MYNKVTNSISISVRPEAVPDQSNPTDKVYCFSYNITIENLGDETVQLLERHWVINSGGSFFDEVVGDGVVGLQPVLEKGQSFEYVSGAVIEDPFGSMKGAYTLRASSGKFFNAEIPEFELVYPDAVH